MYTLHLGNKNYSSWSLRPWLVLKTSDVPFREELHRFGPDSATGGFKRFSPSGRVPCLTEGSTAVWDSLSIVEYLAERHRGVWPHEATARAWARSASAEVHSGFSELHQRYPMTVGVRIEVAVRSPRLLAELGRLDELWNDGLSRFGGPYLAGPHFSAVDAFFAPLAFVFRTFGFTANGSASSYLERLLTLPAMKEWETAALAEDFRDEGYDADIAQAGRVIADHRVPAV